MTVPWFIGSGGALHSPEVVRTLAYAATSGSEGVISAGDMQVQQLGVPGSSVQIVTGACAMLNRSPGGDHQTYVDRELATLQLAIAATGSGAGRSDLIVRRVEDPDYPGFSSPADTVNGPYARYAVISGVPNTTTKAKTLNLGYPAIALARIDIPVSTATITTAMIKDLRKVCKPNRQRETDAIYPGGNYPMDAVANKSIGTSRAIDIPDWATWATVKCDLSGLCLLNGNTTGMLSGIFAGISFPETGYDENWGGSAGAYQRTSYVVAGEFAIPLAMRETAQTVTMRGRRTAGPGYLRSDAYSTLFVDVEFLEKAY